MPEKIKGWQDTCERFVAFLDIMGTKDRLQREGHEKAMDKYKSLLGIKKVMELVPSLEIGRGLANIKPILFSDSIILISPDILEKTLKDMLWWVESILHVSFQTGLPIKGAIACGKMTVNFTKSIYFGQPLIDAVELQKELMLYGVVIHHTVEDSLKKYYLTESSDIVNISAPMKFGNVNHYLVNWTKQLIGDYPDRLISTLYSEVSGKPRIYVDNTLKFLKWLKER